MVTFAETTTPANIKFAENRMLINKNGNINVFVKDGATFSPVQVIPSSSIASFDAQGSRIAFFVSNSEIHVYEWNGSEYVYFENIVNDEPDSVFDEHIAIENDRVAVTIKYNNSDVSKVVYYDVVQGSTTTDVLSIQENQMIMAKNPSLRGYFGWDVSVSDDNNFLAVGSPTEEGGYVSLETVENKLTASDGVTYDNFGYSVAIDGNRMVIGAPGDDYSRGSAYVYELNNGSWTEKQKLTASDGDSYDYFGLPVAIDGDRIVVCSKINDDNGSAYVYELNNGSWTEKQKLTASDGVGGDYFGTSVAIDGDRIVLGAYRDDDKGENSGSVYIYELNNGSWTEKQKLTASDGVGGEFFGKRVAIDGNRIVVGSYGDDSEKGSAYVYELNNGSWTEKQKLTASDGVGGDFFGYSVAIDGDRIVVGSHGDDNLRGSAYIFELNNGSWTEKQKLTASDGVSDDRFGWPVAIDGDRIVLGAYRDDDKGENSGSVYIYELNNGSWTEKQKLTASDGVGGDFFGWGVAIDGNRIVVGSFRDDDKGSDSGSVYVYDTYYESVDSDYPGATPLPNNSGKTNIYQKTSLGYTSYGSVVSPFLQTTDSFGGQISINKDGTQLVVAEMEHAVLGAVHVYNRGPEKFRYAFTIYPPDGTGYFGWDVSLHDNVLAVSASGNIFLYNISQTGATLIQTISLPGTLSNVSIKQINLFVMVATINNNLFTTKMYTWNGFDFQERQMTISGIPEKMGKISLSDDANLLTIASNYEDATGKVHVFKNQGNFQYELLEDIDYPDEVYGVELSNDRLIIGRPFETFFIGDQGYGQAGRAYLYDITTSQKIDYFDTFERKGMINDVLYTTENKNLYLRNKNLFVNYLQNSSDQNANVNFYTWSNLSYNLTQTISKQNAVEFAYDYKMNNTGSSMFITFTNSSGQKQIDEYVFEEGVYVYKRSITNGGNTDFAIDGTRVITSTVENNQGKITAYKQKQEIIIDSTGSSDQTTVETYETEEGGEFKQIRIHLGAPYENFINVDKTLITERLPDITTENLINDGRTLTTDYQSVEEVRLSQTDLLYIYDVKLGQTVIGKYRVFLTSEPYIEVILYVIGLGYSQGLLESDLAKDGGVKIEVKYPSPNIRMARNTIPRLKSVNFQ